ncbi:MAG: hypothetical protein LC721_03180 [Actinobacteria bacterium]|nr:hypothetical protein [Actinomycetota bacterium]
MRACRELDVPDVSTREVGASSSRHPGGFLGRALALSGHGGQVSGS